MFFWMVFLFYWFFQRSLGLSYSSEFHIYGSELLGSSGWYIWNSTVASFLLYLQWFSQRSLGLLYSSEFHIDGSELLDSSGWYMELNSCQFSIFNIYMWHDIILIVSTVYILDVSLVPFFPCIVRIWSLIPLQGLRTHSSHTKSVNLFLISGLIKSGKKVFM